MPYDHKKIEKKWQKEWLNKKIYQAKESSKKPKYYQLETFPYPSAACLHVGHPKGYIAEDIYARFKRMNGSEVLYTMGWDAFGLPTENYAIKVKKNPKKVASANIKNFKRQVKMFGLSYDWDREINTSDPKYYKWTQWLFLQLFKKGLAYRAEARVNWCPKDQTVLANEQVIEGRCERDGELVIQREMEQWFFKITNYAERLLNGLKGLDWPAATIKRQENWIGKSEGAIIQFPISNPPAGRAGFQFPVEVFTTRPDTLFGATYVVLAPEHELIAQLETRITNFKEVKAYVEKAKKKTQLQRQKEEKEKTGIELKSIKAINPANNEEIPVWIADYVLGGYGTGAIMAVPAHDQRDFEFAKKFNLPIRHVIMPAVVDHINPPREDKPSKTRKNVHALVYDPARKKYLIIRNKKFGWDTVVIGGVEEGETLVEAALRELKEETGYVDFEFKRMLGGPVKATYFAKHKDENRIAITTAVYFELKSDKRVPIAEDGDNDGNEILWVDASHYVPGKMVNSELPYWLSRLSKDEDFAYTGEGALINSGKFDGMDSEKAKPEIVRFVGGEKKIQYHLRDWSVSRQRYWGVPIPMIHCAKCGIAPVPEDDLPVVLPDDIEYRPKGMPPLASSKKFMEVKCPICNKDAKRDPETLDTFVDSSWYYLRYADPDNDIKPFDKLRVTHWLPVDLYVIGAEHTVLHLLYSRFITRFLHDDGYLNFEEPFLKIRHVGLILGADGQKMSKSRGNVINPDDLVEKFGVDAVRLYEMFMGPFDEGQPWDPKGIVGLKRFLDRVWKIGELLGKTSDVKSPKTSNIDESDEPMRLLYKTIKKVGEDIDEFKFNTAISALMILLNQMEAYGAERIAYGDFLKLLAPFAPHLTEEIWSKLGNKNSIHLESWPKYDPMLIEETTFELIVQINGKVRDKFSAPIKISQAEATRLTLAREKVKLALDNKKPRKVVFVPKRLINIVV